MADVVGLDTCLERGSKQAGDVAALTRSQAKWFVTNETCSGTYKPDLEKSDNQIWPRPGKKAITD